jgi:hypothetical protein
MSTTIKPLPRDAKGRIKDRFQANGIEYMIITADQGISIERFKVWQQLSLVVGFDANFQKMLQNLTKAQELANGVVTKDNTFTDLVMHLNAMKEGIVSKSEENYSYAMYLCTLFIVDKDEDLTTWSHQIADKKIENWNKEGYDVQDFLKLAVSSIIGFKSAYKELWELIGKKEQ